MYQRFKEIADPYIVSFDEEKWCTDIYVPDFDLHIQGEKCLCHPTAYSPAMDPGGSMCYFHKHTKQLQLQFSA
jgi:hypothetical protein